MKRRFLILLGLVLLVGTGCQKQEAEAPSEKQEIVAETDQEAMEKDLEEVFGDYIIEPNDALKTVFSKSWDVTGTSDVYVLNYDGSGMLNDQAITYECGFNEENQVILSLNIEENGEETVYLVDSDATGYGLDLTPVAEGECLNLFPSDMILLEMSEERVAALVGTWADDNQNTYLFEEDGTLLIGGKESDAPGTWCVLEKEDGTIIVNLLVEGGSLEFEYEVQEEGKTLALYNRSAETWYYWYRS